MIGHPHRTPTFTPPEPMRYAYRLVERNNVPDGITILLVVWVLALIGLSVAIVDLGFNPAVIRAICILAAWGLTIAACHFRVERVPK